MPWPLGPDSHSSWLLSQKIEPIEQAADASEPVADISKQNAENPEVTAQQEMDTDLPEAPPPPLEPAVMARPGSVNLSLHSIVEDRRPKERLSFEVGVGVLGGCGVRCMAAWQGLEHSLSPDAHGPLLPLPPGDGIG